MVTCVGHLPWLPAQPSGHWVTDYETLSGAVSGAVATPLQLSEGNQRAVAAHHPLYVSR